MALLLHLVHLLFPTVTRSQKKKKRKHPCTSPGIIGLKQTLVLSYWFKSVLEGNHHQIVVTWSLLYAMMPYIGKSVETTKMGNNGNNRPKSNKRL
ncbi:uncharacterized protein F4812DRAFT_441736 [Daldinia caldariorum]|uniref:uncharacterized protein n=1 Tax=Daldinia caldariorum TaxID=326644 RepID=UPI002008A9B1|nr:uncharacterized protein F4812DRAFT_441736 [Daldinia caldariorum]KAI1464724.1 hypothetical protein F4812DRAFT_441736 [Daldinia caldariorum]